MKTALLSFLVCSVITGMAAGGKSPGVFSTATERCIDSVLKLILKDCVEIAHDADFHNVISC